MHRRLPLIVAVLAFMLSLTAFTGTVLQTGLFVGEAQAQSSVRPPDNAVNPAPAQPGETREVDRVDGNEALPGQTTLDQQGRNSSATFSSCAAASDDRQMPIANRIEIGKSEKPKSGAICRNNF